jgi:hypothetical protein
VAELAQVSGVIYQHDAVTVEPLPDVGTEHVADASRIVGAI